VKRIVKRRSRYEEVEPTSGKIVMNVEEKCGVIELLACEDYYIGNFAGPKCVA
jgi:hypothetical protein